MACSSRHSSRQQLTKGDQLRLQVLWRRRRGVQVKQADARRALRFRPRRREPLRQAGWCRRCSHQSATTRKLVCAAAGGRCQGTALAASDHLLVILLCGCPCLCQGSACWLAVKSVCGSSSHSSTFTEHACYALRWQEDQATQGSLLVRAGPGATCLAGKFIISLAVSLLPAAVMLPLQCLASFRSAQTSQFAGRGPHSHSMLI